MSTPTPTYVRFPVRGASSRGGFGLSPFRYTVWFAPDHLLLLARAGFFVAFHETYKRFYFGDIRGIGIEWTNSWKTKLWIWGVVSLAGVLAAMIALHSSATGWALFWAIWIVVGLFCAGVVYSGGPSCIVRIHTAVQEEDIPCLNTEAKARKFLAALQPKIEEAQGALPAGASIDKTSLREPTPVPPTSDERRSRSPVIHLILFGLVLGASLVETLTLISPLTFLWILTALFAAAVAILTIAAIVRQTGNPAYSSGLKTMVWILAVAQIFTSIGTYFFLIYSSMNESITHPGAKAHQIDSFGHMLKVMAENPWFTKFLLAQVVLILVIALPGFLLAWRQYQRESERARSIATP